MYDDASTFTVADNHISAVNASADAPWQGVLITSIQNNVGVTFQGNTIDGSAAFQSMAKPSSGYEVWGTSTTGSVLISGGTVTGVDYGVWVNSFEGYNSAGGPAQATISDVGITASQIGLYVEDSPGGGHATVSASISGGSITITGSLGTGVAVSGSAASANISDVTIDPPAVGISVVDGSAMITGNTITSDGDGIDVSGTGQATITGNTITANAVGISVADSATADIGDGTIDDQNTIDAQITGIQLAGTYGDVDTNIIYNDISTGGTGVSVQAGTADVDNNTITVTGDGTGVEVVGASATLSGDAISGGKRRFRRYLGRRRWHCRHQRRDDQRSGDRRRYLRQCHAHRRLDH